ncbi:hypothetical protein LS73_004290 [Helicobacter muridarum]|uniref:Uncharacterized protein n=1 Tax=Helicobacter muridarum TaxID=216 RepID=A0A099TWT3_9HELI|nr:hypothetical protein [Helicobacter muridarum]TLE00634.1 hypothetical protein LS73_004290 [Helicobacter muridarum]STQ85652.1 Uncharacterised protein [Helicobacter muridarum]
MDMGFTLEGDINNRNLSITCTGIISDYESFKDFKKKLFGITKTDEIEHIKNKSFDVLDIKFVDSYPLPDCLVGFLLKLSDRDGIRVNLTTNNNKMLSFFISIFLDEKFNVKLFL